MAASRQEERGDREAVLEIDLGAFDTDLEALIVTGAGRWASPASRLSRSSTVG